MLYENLSSILFSNKDITNDKRLLQAIIENLAEGMIIINPEGQSLYWNHQALEMHGYDITEDELDKLSKLTNSYELLNLNEESIPFEQWPASRIMNGEDLHDYELIIRKKEEKNWQRIFSYSGTLIKDKSGGPVIGMLSIRNVTERRFAERELKKSEEHFRTLADNISQLAWMADDKGWIFWYNKRWYEYTGTTLDQMQGWGWKEVHHPDHVDRVVDKFSKSVTSGELWEDTFPLRSREGEYRWFLSRAVPIRDENEKIVRWFGTNTDITEQKELEEDLSILAQRFKRITESNIMGVVIGDFKGNILEANDYYLNILGYTRQEFEQQKIRWEDMTPSEYLPMDYKAIEEIKEQGACTPYEKEYITKQGQRRWVLIADTLLPGDEPLIVGFIMDITDMKIQQLKLEKTLSELERSNKELEQFAYVASHDLQEPIRMVSSFTQLLSKKYKDRLDPSADTYINFIVEGAKRMHSLINDLLSFSRIASGNPFVITDINLLLESVLSELKVNIIESRAKIIYSELPEIKADPAQVRLLFLNLISNAIKFRGKEDPVVEVSSEKRHKEWFFTIRDNGIGIDPEYHDKIFIIFQRLNDRESYPGTGIGLAICKRIVERHGGRIWVDSRVGQGTAVNFTIPK